MDKNYLQSVAEKVVSLNWAQCQKAYPKTRGLSAPKVVINARLKTTAGRAFFQSHIVDFSAELFWEHTENFVRDTIPHEVAHIATDLQYPGSKAHGQEWRNCYKFLTGNEASRLHHMINSAHEARRAGAI